MNYFAAQMGFAFHFVLPGIGTQGVVHAKHVALNRGTSTTLDQNFNIILKLGTQTIFTKKIFRSFYCRKDSGSFVFGLDFVPKIDCRMG